jgi:hypothetical protein
VVTTFARYDRRIRDKRVVNTWKWHKVCLELIQVDVEGTIEPQAGGNRANDLGRKTVKMVISRARDVQVALANIVKSLVIYEKCAIGVPIGIMCGQDGIVRFHHSGRHAGGWVDHKLQLRLLAILNRKMLEQERTKTRACSSAKGMEDHETLKRRTIICRGISPRIRSQRKEGSIYTPATRRIRSTTPSTSSLPTV